MFFFKLGQTLETQSLVLAKDLCNASARELVMLETWKKPLGKVLCFLDNIIVLLRGPENWYILARRSYGMRCVI